MSQFEAYFKIGIAHILDLNGFDHILFVIALCAIYSGRDWRKIIILVTAFTIGHSITLALATFNIIKVNANLIEFLIPVTIAITAIGNIIRPKPTGSKGIQINYLFALFFGLIHGLGFSNYLRALLGREASLFQPLLAFNLGLEVGQLIIVAIFILVSSIFIGIFSNRKEWTLVTSAIVLGMSLMMILENRYWL